MIKVAIADDHQMFAEAVSSLLETSSHIEICFIAKDGIDLISKLELERPEVLLLDIDMPNLNGKDSLEALRNLWPEQKVIMLTMHDEPSYIKSFLDLDVQGYVLKNTSNEELLKAIKWVAKGNQYIATELLLKVKSLEKDDGRKVNPVELLTERELEILTLSAKELSIPEISKELSVSPNTIKTHRKNILRKLGLKNAMGMSKFAVENGLIK